MEAAAAAEAGLQQDDEEEQQNEAELEFLGCFKTVIVGIRYYTGRVGVNEVGQGCQLDAAEMVVRDRMVKFVREPSNPYDANAVKVENALGEQVGHLKRELVYEIASMLDADDIRIEGIMPGGSHSTFTLPVTIYCFSSSAEAGLALRRKLLLLGIPFTAMSLQEAAAQASGQGSQGSGGRGGGPAAAAAEAAGELRQGPSCTWRLLSWKTASTGCLKRAAPAGRGGGGGVVYTNTLTNFETATRPEPLRGGILADDMGLGKTLMVISLIATNAPGAQLPPVVQAADEAAAAAAAPEEPEKGRPKKRQKKAAGSSTSQLRAAAKRKSDADAAAAAAAAAGGGDSPPAADGPRGTLVVCPLSVLSNWQTQIEEHTAGNLQVAVYHGPERNRSRAWLAQQDVVITTYATLAGDVGLRGGGGLLGQQWLRVVLDEAHTIRNSETQQAKACRALKAQRRWAVTGTPLQNRLADVYGLLVFLGLKPLDDRAFWRRCVERPLRQRDSRALLTLKVLMGSLALRRTKDSSGPDGRPLVALPPKTVTVVRLELGPEDALNYARLEGETKSLGEAKSLVRTQRRCLLGLLYEGVWSLVSPYGDAGAWLVVEGEGVAHHLSRGTLVQNYTNVLAIIMRLRQVRAGRSQHWLAIIMRLRQVCDSSRLCPQALEALRAAAASAKAGEAGEAAPPAPELLAKLLAAVAGEGCEECAICLSPLELPCITSCGHVYCRRCIESVIVRDKPCCPLCRQPISADSLLDPPPAAAADGEDAAADQQAAAGGGASSAAAAAGCSKIQALLAKLREVQQEEAGMLDLIGAALRAEGISFVRVDGKSSAKARKDAIQAFAGGGGGAPRVFLASLKAAGLGTNLTAGSHVHLMDPWWNPAVEDQAMDRVHRLGQSRAVYVWRYVALGTIEERMLELQDVKAQLAKAAWMEQQQARGSAGAGSSRGAAAAAAGGRSAAAGGGGGLGIRADDLRRLMDL
ncbi:SNF2 family N-terminal domain-containing protein [Scenedesmus sp. NREL 46B-D3]|nr:SNF2 family N-terminal domain-containing protein [Scenedesmus sp. NREL 46B-D3]